ncbi:MAG: ATP-binding protein [Chloroflexota bacterium]
MPAIDVQALLAQGMGADLHWFPSDVSPTRLAAVLCGMANAQGGRVLLGVAPRSAQVLGVSDVGGMQDLVFQAALLVDPPLVLPLPQAVPVALGGRVVNVVLVSVPAGLPNVYSVGGSYLGREGAQTNPLPARRLRQLLVERGALQFETQAPPDATLDDLDPDRVDAYLAALDLPGDESREQVLLRRGCLRLPPGGAQAGDGRAIRPAYRPTYAGLLMFGRRPQRWLPGATILAARFSGPSLAERFIKQEISGCLPDQLYAAEAFLRDNLRSVVQVNGLAHAERLEYPLEALRELLVNAAAHRDYNLQGDMVHINLFTDRIEIHSPGGLPGPMTLDTLFQARFSRNPVIMQLLADLGFVERLGFGLNRVVGLLQQGGWPPAGFNEVGGSFRVTLYSAVAAPAVALPPRPAPGTAEVYSAPAGGPVMGGVLPTAPGGGALVPGAVQGSAGQPAGVEALNPRQQAAIGFLGQHKRITSRDFQELCPDVHAETLRRDLAGLVERGLLVKIGDKRATYYMLKR